MYSKEELISHIRKRPGMFVGSMDFRGIKCMIEYFIDDTLTDPEKQVYRFEIHPDNRMDITLTGIDIDQWNRYLQTFMEPDRNVWGLQTLLGLSEHILIWQGDRQTTETYIEAKQGVLQHWAEAFTPDDNSLQVSFRIDPAIFGAATVNYEYLGISLAQFAYLNPSLKIVLDNHVGDYRRNIFLYPDGIKDWLDHLISQLPQPYHDLYMPLNTSINGFTYQIAICYPGTASPYPYIRSFANNYETYLEGSLVDGILAGLTDAFKKIESDVKLNVNKRKLKKGLYILAAVKGQDLIFWGSLKWTPGMPQIKKDIRRYIYEETLKHLQTHPKDVDYLVSKFGVWEED